MSEIGHNSQSVASAELLQYIERAERLLEEKKGIQDDVKDVMLEAKSQGYCVKTIRKIIQLRAMDKHARDESEALLETYRAALGL